MTDREAVRGDSIRFDVQHGGSTSGWTASLELRRHPADPDAIASLSSGDGIAPSGSSWQVEIPESVTRAMAPPGRRGIAYYQLRATQGSPGDTRTLEDGVIRILPDATRAGDSFSDATVAVGDQGGF